MAEITKSTKASLATTLPPQNAKLSGGLFAGMALGILDACYVKASDGLVYKSSGASANAAAKVRGFAARSYSLGDPVTLWRGPVTVLYADASGMTTANNLFLSGTVAGGLADAASTGGTAPIGWAINDQMAELYASNY